MNELEMRHAAKEWLPEWMVDFVEPGRPYEGDVAQVTLAVELAKQNVDRGTGGPFGAAIFEAGTGRLVGAAVNRVAPLSSVVLHAEILAFLVVEQALGRPTLRDDDGPGYVLAASCEPCAMCLGAALWSGVRRIVCAATGADARRIGFDEGPVDPAGLRSLTDRGVTVVRGVMREEGIEVLEAYANGGGDLFTEPDDPAPNR